MIKLIDEIMLGKDMMDFLEDDENIQRYTDILIDKGIDIVNDTGQPFGTFRFRLEWEENEQPDTTTYPKETNKPT